MAHSALRLVQDSEDAEQASTDPVDRVFGHWVFMLGKNARRCALGPGRRKAISKALGLYGEDTLVLAIDGCAASAWHRGENDRGREYTDIELILRDEAHIERFADEGEALRVRLAKEEVQRQARAAIPQVAAVVDPVAEAEQRRRLRALADRLSGKGGHV